MKPEEQHQRLAALELETALRPVSSELVDQVGRVLSASGLNAALLRYLDRIRDLQMDGPFDFLYRLRHAVMKGDLKALVALFPAVQQAASTRTGLEIGLGAASLELNSPINVSDLLEIRLQRDEPLCLCEAQLLAGMAAKTERHRMLRAPFKHIVRRLNGVDKSPDVAPLLHLAIALLHCSTEPANARLHLKQCEPGEFLEPDLAVHAAITALRLGLTKVASRIAAHEGRPAPASPILLRIRQTISILDGDPPPLEDDVSLSAGLTRALKAIQANGLSKPVQSWLVANPGGEIDCLPAAGNGADPPVNALGTVSVIVERDAASLIDLLRGADLSFAHYVVFKPSGRICVFHAAADGMNVWPWEARSCRLTNGTRGNRGGGGAPLISDALKELGSHPLLEEQ